MEEHCMDTISKVENGLLTFIMSEVNQYWCGKFKYHQKEIRDNFYLLLLIWCSYVFVVCILSIIFFLILCALLCTRMVINEVTLGLIVSAIDQYIFLSPNAE